MKNLGGKNRWCWLKFAAIFCKRTSMMPVFTLLLGSLVIVGILCSPRTFLSLQGSSPRQDGKLDVLLQRVSMENKTLILTVINKPYAEKNSMLELFLQSFQVGEDTQHLIKHLLIVAVDQAAFDKCRQLHPNCYKLIVEGVDFSGEQLYLTKDYLKMMWRRILFVAYLLRRGYDVVFTDTDILWLRNPFTRFSSDDDMQISCDKYQGQPYNVSNRINAGFYFVRSNNKTIQLYDLWYKSQAMGIHEQDVLQKLQKEPAFKKLGLKFRFLDTFYFGGFCQTSRNIREANTMHANCCKTIKAKLTDLRAVFQAWKNFMATDRNSPRIAWPYAKACQATLGGKKRRKKKEERRSQNV